MSVRGVRVGMFRGPSGTLAPARIPQGSRKRGREQILRDTIGFHKALRKAVLRCAMMCYVVL